MRQIGCKPSKGTPIDWNNRLSRGLRRVFLFDEGGGSVARDRVTKSPGNITGNYSWILNGLQFGASEDRIIHNMPFNNTYYPSGSIDVCVMPYWNHTDGIDHYIWDIGDTEVARALMVKNALNSVAVNLNNANKLTTTITLNAYSIYHFVINWPSVTLYVNGILAATGTSSGLGNGSGVMYIGDRYTSPSKSWDGRFYWFNIRNRELSADEVAAIYIDPYQIYQRDNYPLMTCSESVSAYSGMMF